MLALLDENPRAVFVYLRGGIALPGELLQLTDRDLDDKTWKFLGWFYVSLMSSIQSACWLLFESLLRKCDLDTVKKRRVMEAI